jgi:hypothetical protein
MVEWGCEIGDCNEKGLQGIVGGCEIDGGGDKGRVVLGVDEVEVAFDGCGEVWVVGGSDGEGGGDQRGLRFGP